MNDLSLSPRLTFGSTRTSSGVLPTPQGPRFNAERGTPERLCSKRSVCRGFGPRPHTRPNTRVAV